MKGKKMEPYCGITTIDTGYLRDQFAASHLMVEEGKAAFIDVGTSHSVERLLAALHAQGLRETDVQYVIVTHIHLDHAGGAGRLLELCPNARLVVHPKGARHMVDPEKLIAGAVQVYGSERFAALYGQIQGVAQQRVIEAAADFQLDLNGRRLTFLDTPGHARHHFCVWDEKSRGVFTGDAFGLAYPQLQLAGRRPFLLCTTSPSAFEPEAMVDSIERVMKLEPETLYLTHFGPVPADTRSVAALKTLVMEHVVLARETGGELSRLMDGIAEQFDSAYRDYLDGQDQEVDLASFLRDDVELNAQGLKVWLQRQNG